MGESHASRLQWGFPGETELDPVENIQAILQQQVSPVGQPVQIGVV
ncbi:hypothetical protein [Pseudomonas gingeri]|uniref:Uncharacterized protein n=1 Tax=Pseudomonas gingeri TaxID=117681 RepID=A0A7Y7WYR0_9PSED|nr:hypothetical protein [Pseudomonas gingeri]NWB88992.1 hypothetical protein [Pseudomonas gingeri]